MSVDLIIVNWNGGPEVMAAIASGQRFGANVIVVDNASTVGVAATLDSVANIRLIRNPTNLGFGAGSNRGVAAGTADHVFLLNPDAEIIRGTADELERFFATSGAMLVGFPLEQPSGLRVPSTYPAPDGRQLLIDLLRLDAVRHRLGLKLKPRARTPRSTWVVGAALAMRRSDWERLGGLDEGYFLWYEDVDLGAQVARAGGSVAIAQEVLVRHIGASTWTRLPRRRRQWLRILGTYRYAAKHLGHGAAAAIVTAAPLAMAIGVALDAAHWLTRRH